MKNALFVCLVAFAWSGATSSAVAQLPTEMQAKTVAGQTMQKGVSVQLAGTNNASPVPDADGADAWIVAVAADGSLYFGADPVTSESLLEAMKHRPRNREQKLYIKADARAAFARVEKVLEAARVDFFQAAVLLTAQAESPEPGEIAPPKGLEVSIVPPASASNSIVVQINSGQPSPTLKVNGDETSFSDLKGTLDALLENGIERVVMLKADQQMPFAQVAKVIDTCRAAGARIVLPGPEL
jgi:biopolymer transport protein ExbD